ncbi:MAG: Type 1 glutamine amidotransferase-like domain-containing protein [Acidimicrobiales bacterium]
MPAETPTILATSGGLLPDARTFIRPGPLLDLALELCTPGDVPRLCFLNTAGGDQAWWNGAIHAAYYDRDVRVSCLNLFPMPNVADPAAHLLAQDAVWVGGGSTANLLALWRLHGLDTMLRRCWESGVVLAGVSAGSICWHLGGTTDSFGPDLRPVTDGLGFLPFSNGVHYDAEEQRRPLFHRLVADGTLPDGYATDNGVGLVYRGTEMVEAVSEAAGQGAYRVQRGPAGGVEETRMEPRLLPGAAEGPSRAVSRPGGGRNGPTGQTGPSRQA